MLIATFTSRGEEQTMGLAERLARALEPGDILALRGHLGAGKTCFVRGLVRGLGIEQARVSSPTFVICKEYAEANGLVIEHIDAYRLSGPDDLDSIGWDEMLRSGEVIMAVEWPERLGDALPAARRIDISFQHAGLNERIITVEAEGEIAARLNERFSV